MSGRRSRIAHPLGDRFIRLDMWVINALGNHAAAACLSVLDFFDRLRDSEGEWLGVNAGQVQNFLGGLFGRDKVRAALNELIRLGWIQENETVKSNGQLFYRQRDLRLCPTAINAYIEKNNIKTKKCDFQEVRSPESRDAVGLNPGTKDLAPGKPLKAAAAAVAAEEKNAAAARSGGKLRRPRPSGIVCFYADDHPEAQAIEAEFSKEEIDLACRQLSGKREPVPGVVRKLIEDQRSKAGRAASQRAKLDALDNLPVRRPKGSARAALNKAAGKKSE